MPRLLVPTVRDANGPGSISVNLPTYNVIEYSEDGNLAVVDVPGADVDDRFPTGLPLRRANQAEGRDARSLTAVQRIRWYAHLDERYAEVASRFRPV